MQTELVSDWKPAVAFCTFRATLSDDGLNMRPAIIALLIGVLAGYYIGFKDSFRGERSIGGRVGVVLGTVDPNELRYERHRRAQMMRDSIRSKSGLDSVAP